MKSYFERSWIVLKTAALHFREHRMTDWAAALTFHGLLSLFPALIALAAIIGLLGDPDSTTREITQIIRDIGPDSAAETFEDPVRSITSNKSAAGILLVVGLLSAIWSASGYLGAFTRASNAAWETKEDRAFAKLRPTQMLITLGFLLMMALILISMALTGPVVDAIGSSLGIKDTVVSTWEVAKWPVIVSLAVLLFSLLYYVTPSLELAGLRSVLAGSCFAVLAWIIASLLFGLYVSNFGSYDKTYGTLGGLVTLLVWMWITNLALLFGVEINAERRRRRTSQ